MVANARQSVLCAVACAAAMLLGGCNVRWDYFAKRPALEAWAAGEMTGLTERTPRAGDDGVFQAESNTINLAGAANETLAVQLVVEAGEKPVEGLVLSWSGLAGPGGAAIDGRNIRAFRMWPIRVERYPPWRLRLVESIPEPAGVYDVLIPLEAPKNGQPFDVPAGGRLALWIDLHVPRGAGSGAYTGPLTLKSRSHKEWTATLSVKVHDFVLPDARPLAAVGGFDHSELFRTFLRRDGKPYEPMHLDRQNPLVQRGLAILRQLMRLSHEHRLDLFDRSIRPLLKRDTFGKVRLEWDDYDAIVGPYLKGGAFDDRVGCPAWPSPFSDTWPSPELYGGADSEAYAEVAGGVLAECRRHLASEAQVAEQVFLWPYRGPVTAEAFARQARLARLARAVDAQTPILTHLPVSPPAMTGWQVPGDFRSLSDILAPRAEWFDPSLAPPARPENPLSGLWLSPGTPPYLPSLGVIASPADARAVPWFAMKYRCSGLMLPEVLDWGQDPFAPAEADQDSPESQYKTRLFYPGAIAGLDEALPSVRLKRLRRGLTDITYIWLLQLRQRTAVADAIVQSMARYAGTAAAGDNYLDVRLGGWVAEGATWEMARRLLAEEVHAAIHPGEESNPQLLAQRLAWKQFDERTRTARVEQVRSRVTPAPGQADGAALQATVLLDLYNEFGRDADVLVRIDKLPEGWQAVTDQVRLEAMPAGARKVVALSARGSYVPAQGDGKMPLPLSLTIDMRQRRELAVSVPLLTVARATRPPAIDGRLDDWPTRQGATAGGFRLLGRRRQAGTGQAERQTLVYAMCDEANLYLAFRCEEPNPAGMVARSDNVVRYQQLMACGEDLVEAILDPGADARGPEDLYHVVVKSNGVVVAERGVRTEPPLGKAEPWPVAAVAAVGRHEKFWAVELAIPLSAFGQESQARFWGANFTRFSTQGQEASSWSEAARYFYDPRNLGTMVMPARAGSGGE